MTIFGQLFSPQDYLPDPHTLSGSWTIVLLVIAAVIFAGLALRVFFPVNPTLASASPARTYEQPQLVLTAAGKD